MTGRREEFDQAMSLGHSAAWDQQWDRAIAAYRSALAEFPDDAVVLTSLAFALLQGDHLDEALRMYQRAANLNPGDPVAPEKCGEIFERQGRLNDAAQTFLAVAQVHLKRHDIIKAIDNWARVVRLTPDNLAAHSRLAQACERTNQTHRAVLEYIEVARIFQRTLENEKASAAVTRALQLEPQSNEARDALDKLRRGVQLPMPEQAASGSPPPFDNTAPAAAAAADAPRNAGAAGPASPLADLLEPALTQLADMLFEEDAELAKRTSSVESLTRGTGQIRGDQARRSKAIKHLGQAISLNATGETAAAIKQYENALDAGLESPVVSLVLGALLLAESRPAEAAKHFKAALNHDLFGVGGLYGLGLAENQLGESREAVFHLLGALRRLDQQTVPTERQDALAEAYESLAEGLQQSTPQQLAPIAANVVEFLSGDGWRERLSLARQQLDRSSLDGQSAPLADLLAVPGAGQVVESLRRIETYMGQHLWDTAMEEAYYAVTQSPTHLPVHIRIAEILAAENSTQAAMEKYAMVAQSYRIRGELVRAARITLQALRLSPLDVVMRAWLIGLLVEQHKYEEALQQFCELADTYYRLADLQLARKSYADALLLAQQNNMGNEWSVRLLHKIGDIDLQRLNWHEAQQVYEQIKNLAPDDEAARATLIDLMFRLGSGKVALAETDAYLRQLLLARKISVAVSLLAELVDTHGQEAGLVARLARLYQDAGQKAQAITQYDRLGELQLQAGHKTQAAATIRAILALQPEHAGAYQQLLGELQQASP